MVDRVSTVVRLAGIQMEPTFGDIQGNIASSVAWIRRAADAGAQVVILPEAAAAGYVFRDRSEAAEYAQTLSDGPTIRAWCDAAKELGVYVVGGFTEKDATRIYNSAVLISPEGVQGRFRKAHLWNDEKQIYDCSQDEFPVFDTPFGRVCMAICYDAWFPETFRSAALQDADLLVLPSNWVPVPGQPDDALPMANLMCMTGAHSNQLFVAGVSRVGRERGQDFVGSSVIVGPDGWPMSGPASSSREDMILADVDLLGTRHARRSNPFNQPVRDRRPDLYVGMGPAN